MVLPSLFRKASHKVNPTDRTPKLQTDAQKSSAAQGTPPSSPDKKSHSRVKDRERDRDRRSSASFSSKRSSKYDRNSHPLNLPPDELRRLSSQMSAMQDQPTPTPMDIDRDQSPAPSSPAAPKANGDAPRPAPPPHRYTTSPPPENAKYAQTPEESSPPAEPPTIDAEEYKAAGNKFFKIKDYPAAIREYTKGASRHTPVRARARC